MYLYEYMLIRMSSKNISITKEAYRRLKVRKEKNKSFTDVILEMTEESRNDYSNLINSDVNISWREVKKNREKTSQDERREKILLGH